MASYSLVEINLQGEFKGSKTLQLVLVIPLGGSGEQFRPTNDVDVKRVD